MPRHVSFSLLGAVVILVSGGMYCIPLLREKQAQKREQLRLTNEITAELARSTEIEGRIAAVKSDPKVVERLGREKFGLARTGELVFKFRGDLPPASSGTAPRTGR